MTPEIKKSASSRIGGKTGALPSLDGLRAFSIGLVILGHGIGPWGSHSFLFRYFFLHAGLGVRVFFVISGFLITTLLLDEKARFGSISLKLFYIRRALRILPAFCGVVVTTFLLSALGYLDIPSSLWAFVLTYTLNFVALASTPGIWPVGHFWSLSVEEQFYLLWPLVLRFTKLRTWVGIAILAIFAGILIRAISVTTGIELIDPARRYAFPFVSGPIASGCLLAITASHVRRMFDEHPWLSGPAATGLAVVLVLFLDTLDLGSANRFIAVITSLLVTFCTARFVLRPAGMIAALLNSPPIVFIGKLSYSLYLWQELFFNPFSSARMCRFPLNLCGVFAMASLSYFLIETQFLRLRKRFQRGAIQMPTVLRPQSAIIEARLRDSTAS